MSKRLVDYVHGLVEAVLLDYLDHYPADRRSVEKDLVRLSTYVKDRGLPVFTLDFPAHLKHFDKCLSEGAYCPSELPLTRSLKGTVIPRLFSGILLRIFDGDGLLRQNADVTAVATYRQLMAVGKKLRLDCERSKVYETVADFFRDEDCLPPPDHVWSGAQGSLFDRHRVTVDTFGDRRALRGVHRKFRCDRHAGTRTWSRIVGISFDIVSSTLGVFDPLEWLPKHGPGAVSDLQRYRYKYQFPCWSDRLERVFPVADFAFANYGIWASEHESCPELRKELSSKLIEVPKTQKGPRLIASEPVANQFCQQALWRFFLERSERTWIKGFISLRDQSFNQDGARRASMGGYWTVDLSSASDRLSARLVERFFGGNSTVLEALKATRTTHLRQDIDLKSSRYTELNKFSTMGSACTFPVQSLVFLGIALAAVCLSRGIVPSIREFKKLSGEVRVYGDDIIIPADAGVVLEELLTFFHFKVNESKTHRNGNFRESCGLDVFKGYDVTPAYVLTLPEPRRPESVISSVESSNNFYRKGWWRAAELIRSTVAMGNIPVVSADSGQFGFITYSRVEQAHFRHKRRWNPDLHREEVLILQPNVRTRWYRAEGSPALLQYFVEEPSPTEKWMDGHPGRPRKNLRRKWVPVELLVSRMGSSEMRAA